MAVSLAERVATDEMLGTTANRVHLICDSNSVIVSSTVHPSLCI